MTTPAETMQNSLTLRRTIRAPRQKVFDAWTQPQHLAHWWRVNSAWTTPIVEIDLRVGGKYRLGMQNPEKPAPHVCCGQFRVVEPPEKLVYTWSWEPPGMEVGETLVTVEFRDLGESTEIVLRHEKFPNAQAAAEHTKGWTGCLEMLAARLESA